MFSSDLLRKLFNDAELILRISLNEEMFCTALTFNLCLHLLWSIGCQICWYHWFLCHVRARYVTLDIPLKRSHLALSLVMPSGSWTLCFSVLPKVCWLCWKVLLDQKSSFSFQSSGRCVDCELRLLGHLLNVVTNLQAYKLRSDTNDPPPTESKDWPIFIYILNLLNLHHVDN